MTSWILKLQLCFQSFNLFHPECNLVAKFVDFFGMLLFFFCENYVNILDTFKCLKLYVTFSQFGDFSGEFISVLCDSFLFGFDKVYLGSLTFYFVLKLLDM